MKQPIIIGYDRKFYCPICDRYYSCSSMLFLLYQNDGRVEWLSNMVTHYRHVHNKTYNTDVSKPLGEIEYLEIKQGANETSKRQIARKCYEYMCSFNIGLRDLLLLTNNSAQTVELYEMIFNKV